MVMLFMMLTTIADQDGGGDGGSDAGGDDEGEIFGDAGDDCDAYD